MVDGCGSRRYIGTNTEYWLSSTYKVTQLFILHWSYLTPQLLQRQAGRKIWNVQDMLNLPTLLFICLEMSKTTGCNRCDYNGAFKPDLVLCFLGYLNPNNLETNQVVAIKGSFFIAHKLITSRWVSPNPPTLEDWIQEMDKHLMFEKYIYAQPNASWKFEKIWQRWIDSSCSSLSL